MITKFLLASQLIKLKISLPSRAIPCAAILILCFSCNGWSVVNAESDVQDDPFERATGVGSAAELTKSTTPNQANRASITQSHKLGPFMRSALERMANGNFRTNGLVRINNINKVLSYINLTRLHESDLLQLSALNVEVEVVNKSLGKIQAWIDISQLEDLLMLQNVEMITTPRFAQTRTGEFNSEGDSILRADQLRELGFTGQNIKVGVLSDGSNNWQDASATNDLPPSITQFGNCSTRAANPQQCEAAVSCNEGTAMAEIIHDLAPDAKIAIAAASTSLEFIQGMNQLANEFQADIIVDDLGFYMEPFFEDGEVAQAVESLSAEILYISSAGNNGNNHYEGQYKNTAQSLHDFATGDVGMGVLAPSRDFVKAILQWNEEFDAPGSDYDLFITQGITVLGSSQNDQSLPGSSPIEVVCVENPSSTNQVYEAKIVKRNGAERRLELFLLGSPDIQYKTPAGSIFGHPGIPRTLAVATINASEPGNNNIATYSSQGPSRIDFPNIINRAKPDLTAIDGVQVSGAGGFSSPFFGTSAAAPHVAAVAALLMSSSSSANAVSVKKALTRGAVDLGAKGMDSVYGYGLIDAILANSILKIPILNGPLFLLLDD